MFLKSLTCAALLWHFCLFATASATEVPESVDSCLRSGASELLSTTGRSDLWRIYRKYTDYDQLGEYLYGPRIWPTFSTRQKQFGYQLFFESLASVSTQSGNSIDESTVHITKMRLAERTPQITKQLNGVTVVIYRVVTTITDQSGKELTATVYLSASCDVFDLQQGALLSKTVDVSVVERFR